MNIVYGVLAGAACLLFNSLAYAELPRGAYVGLGAGTVHSTIASKANRVVGYAPPSEREKSDVTTKLYTGYSWGAWGVEAGYHDLGAYKLTGDWYVLNSSGVIIGTAPVSDKFSAKALALNAVYFLPAGDAFTLFGKLGLASVKTRYECQTLCGYTNGVTTIANNSTTSLTPVIGLGASWNVAKHFALRGEFETFRGAKFKYLDAISKANYDSYSLSAEFRF